MYYIWEQDSQFSTTFLCTSIYFEVFYYYKLYILADAKIKKQNVNLFVNL